MIILLLLIDFDAGNARHAKQRWRRFRFQLRNGALQPWSFSSPCVTKRGGVLAGV